MVIEVGCFVELEKVEAVELSKFFQEDKDLVFV